MEEHIEKFIHYADMICHVMMTKENNKIGFFKKKKYKVFKYHLDKYREELKGIANVTDIYSLEVVKHMYDYLRLCEAANIIDEYENNINAVSLRIGLETNPENDYYFLIRNETKLVQIMIQESIDSDKFIACLDHMYFHAYKLFATILKNDAPYDNYIFKSAKKYDSVIQNTSKLIRSLVESKVMTNDNLEFDTSEYKAEVKETTKNLVKDITGSVEEIGFKNITMDSMPILFEEGNLKKLTKSINDKYKKKGNGMYKQGKVVDGVSSLLKIVSDSNKQGVENKETSKIMRTLCEVLKTNKDIKQNQHLQRLITSVKKDFGGKNIDNDTSIDSGLLKKLSAISKQKKRMKIIHVKK
jgi:translation elongation factor EF-1beta